MGLALIELGVGIFFVSVLIFLSAVIWALAYRLFEFLIDL